MEYKDYQKRKMKESFTYYQRQHCYYQGLANSKEPGPIRDFYQSEADRFQEAADEISTIGSL